MLTLGCVGSFFLSCEAFLALFPSPCLTGLAPLPEGAGQAPGHPVASWPSSASMILDQLSRFSILFMPYLQAPSLFPLPDTPRPVPGVLRTREPQQVHLFLWCPGGKKPGFQAGAGHGWSRCTGPEARGGSGQPELGSKPGSATSQLWPRVRGP